MLRTGEEAGLCAWVLSHTILCMFVYMCDFSYSPLCVWAQVMALSYVCVCVCVCVCVYVCVLSLSFRQSFGQSPPELLRPMPSPPGSHPIPGCSLGHLTARRLST